MTFAPLVDVVIVNSRQAYLLPQSCAIQRFVVLDIAQTKERNYCN
jgi:hypothetical protein